MYVEELIGPETVNTMPPKTLEAFRQHGNVRRATVLEAVDEADAQLRRLAELGIGLDEIAEKPQVEGIAALLVLTMAPSPRWRKTAGNPGGRRDCYSGLHFK